MWPLRIREGVKEHCTTKIEKVISILLMKSRPNRVTTAVTVQVIVGVGYSKAQKVIFTWHTPSGQNNMPFGTTKHKQNDLFEKKLFFSHRRAKKWPKLGILLKIAINYCC